MIRLTQLQQRSMPRLGLLAMDRLEPSPDLMDVAAFDTKPLPLQVVFWRRHLQGGRVTDKVLHRNPLLDEPLLDAVEVVMLDTLHTLYLGVMLCPKSSGGRSRPTLGAGGGGPWSWPCEASRLTSSLGTTMLASCTKTGLATSPRELWGIVRPQASKRRLAKHHSLFSICL